MAGEPVVTIVGNLTSDPELRYVASGQPVANFTVASTPRNLNRQTNQWEDGEAMFVRCAVWREYAENVADSLTKGMRVIVTGRLKVRSYQANDGSTRTSIEMDVDEVGPSLRWAKAQVSRAGGQGGGGNRGGFGGQQGGGQGGFGGAQGGYGQPSYGAPRGGGPGDEFASGGPAPAGGSAFDNSEPPF